MIEQVRILRASGLRICKLEDEINRYIAEGWQPMGEMKVVRVDRSDILIQQVVLPQIDNSQQLKPRD